MTDYITLNLANYNLTPINQYKDPKKFESLLAKMKKDLYYELGVNSALQHESLSNKKVDKIRISDFFQFRSNILKKNRPKIFLRLDSNLKDEELKSVIEIAIKSDIVDALVIGGMQVSYSFKLERK